MGRLVLLSLSLVLLFATGSLAFDPPFQPKHQRPSQFQPQEQCRIERLEALEPTRRVRAEAGLIERWDPNEEQLQCAGVAVERVVVERNGLFLPSYSNTPMLIYVLQGKGIFGTVFPGCPETYESVQFHSQRHNPDQSPRFQEDQHQKIRNIKEGDVIALPAGVTNWAYNDGDERLVTVTFSDVSNHENQLDQEFRTFFLAGNPRQQQKERLANPLFGGKRSSFEQARGDNEGSNVFSGFDTEIIAQSYNVEDRLAQALKSACDGRGPIVSVEGGLQVIKPPRLQQEQQELPHREHQQQQKQQQQGNGLEETICSFDIKRNIQKPSFADVFNPQGGRISSLNSLDFPILRHLQLSFEEGFLYRNSIEAPHFHPNAHNVIYAKRGRARVQVVDDKGNAVFDGELRQGQLLVVPQNFAAVKKTEQEEGFNWIGLKTNDRAQITPLAGKTSVMRALPVDVITNAFQVSREDAWRLKNARKETTIFSAEQSPSQFRRPEPELEA